MADLLEIVQRQREFNRRNPLRAIANYATALSPTVKILAEVHGHAFDATGWRVHQECMERISSVRRRQPDLPAMPSLPRSITPAAALSLLIDWCLCRHRASGDRETAFHDEAPSRALAPALSLPSYENLPPLTQGDEELRRVLAGHRLSGPQIKARLKSLLDVVISEDAVRKRVKAYKSRGRKIEHIPGCGYSLPDAPPPPQ